AVVAEAGVVDRAGAESEAEVDRGGAHDESLIGAVSAQVSDSGGVAVVERILADPLRAGEELDGGERGDRGGPKKAARVEDERGGEDRVEQRDGVDEVIGELLAVVEGEE